MSALPLQEHLIHVAPTPVLSGLERSHDWVLRLMEVFRCVLVLGGIATTNIAAFQAKAQVDPRVTHFQALFTTVTAWGDVANLFKVRARLFSHTRFDAGTEGGDSEMKSRLWALDSKL